MGPGGIAIAYAVIRLSRVIDEVGTAVKSITEETTPLLEEVTTTVKLVNGPLHSINRVTKSVEDISSKISTTTSAFLDKNELAMKVAGGLLTAAQLRKGKNRTKAKTKGKSSKKSKSFVDDEESE
jgi:uncharacterized protein YoxC